MNIVEVDELKLRKPLFAVYQGKRLVAAFPKESTAQAYIQHLRIVKRRQRRTLEWF